MTAALDATWAEFQARNPAVRPARFVITAHAPRSGCGSADWAADPVITINYETLAQPARAVAWLAHMAAHAASGPRTAAEGGYHGAAWLDAAIRLGMVESGPVLSGTGHQAELPAGAYADAITRLRAALEC